MERLLDGLRAILLLDGLDEIDALENEDVRL